jgi:hypothetical protein
VKLEDVQTFEVGDEIRRDWAGGLFAVEEVKDSFVGWRDTAFSPLQRVPMQLVYIRMGQELLRIPANERHKIELPEEVDTAFR